MNNAILALAVAAVALGPALTAPAHSQVLPRKKMIEYGWDVPYPPFVRDHIADMEKRPFDGLIFRLDNYNNAFDPRPWTIEKLQPQLDALRDIKWSKFTDNFLTLYSANQSKMSWFDDAQWKQIVANLKLTSKAAKIGHCVGICFDPEPYGPNPWIYQGQFPGKNYAEVAAQVRKRGAQFMAALRSELPDVRVLTFFHLSLFRDLALEPDPAKREARLSGTGWPADWGLLIPFVNGWLDGSGPGVRIVDGNEMSYYYTSSEEFFRAYYTMRQGVLPLVAPEDVRLYRDRVQAGAALYMDHLLALRDAKDSPTSHSLSPENRLKWLEHNAYMALTTTDEYVWCYSEKMSWWENKVPDGADEAIRAAREKVVVGKPLAFDLAPIMATTRR